MANAKTGKKTLPATDWRVGVLKGLNAPVTTTNLNFLSLWQRFEGANNYNNPLNTTLNTKNVVGTWNSSGVKQYNSPQAGIDATVQTLKSSYYTGIVSLLRKGNAAPGQLAAAVENSPWDGGHYGATKGTLGGRTVYSGGRLSQATLGGLPKGSGGGFLGGVPGDVAHYATHPISGLGVTGKATERIVTKPLDKIGMYVLYGGAIAGGGLLMLTGFVLVAADIGLHKGAQAQANKVAGVPGVGRTVSAIRSRTPKAKARARDEAAYKNRSYRVSREGTGSTRKVRVSALGPNATKTDRKMLGKTRTVRKTDDIPF